MGAIVLAEIRNVRTLFKKMLRWLLIHIARLLSRLFTLAAVFVVTAAVFTGIGYGFHAAASVRVGRPSDQQVRSYIDAGGYIPGSPHNDRSSMPLNETRPDLKASRHLISEVERFVRTIDRLTR